MTTVVNGIDVYVTEVNGTATSFIRQEGLTPVEDNFLSTLEGNVATTSASQAVKLAITAGTDATGLANDTTTYTATVNVDGTDNAVSIVGNAAQTFDALVTELNVDLTGATAAIVGTDIVITSASTGTSSSISITDVNLFSSLNGYVSIEAAKPANLKRLLGEATFASTGQNAWERFSGYVEVYDTASDDVVLSTDLASRGVTYNQAEANAVISMVNALRAKMVEAAKKAGA